MINKKLEKMFHDLYIFLKDSKNDSKLPSYVSYRLKSIIIATG